VLDEKHVLKRAADGLVPREIVARKKQPYRAPDALSFFGADAPDYVGEALSPEAIREANVFAAEPVARLARKCREQRSDAPLSNADNMALVGVLSTQLLHREFLASSPAAGGSLSPGADVMRKAA